jgi:rhomboid family GlyGly-CTERM serine protease
MINLPLKFKYTVNPLIVIALALILFYLEPLSTQWLRFERPQIASGELWRLLTGNLLHTNFTHFLLNCAGVLFVWLLHAEHYTNKSYFFIFSFCGLTCGLGLYLFSDLTRYVGLSGALHGIIVYGAIKDIKTSWPTSGWLLTIGIIIKVAHENSYGPSDSVKAMINADVAVEAHLYGLIGGLILALPLMREIYLRFRKRTHP